MPVTLSRTLVLMAAYLVAAIPFGMFLGRLRGVDVRRVGSGNIGATNVLRHGGVLVGVATLLLDAGKGAAAVALALRLEPEGWLAPAAAVAAVLGHRDPPYLRFRGGKGVATAAGAFAVLSPGVILAAMAVFALVLVIFRRVSAASISAAAALPVLAWSWNHGRLALAILPAAALVLWRHRANMRRLLAGEETSLW